MNERLSDLALIVSPAIPAPFRHGFSTRAGGVSAAPFDTLNVGRTWGDAAADVEENRRRLQVASGARTLVWPKQVHGNGVAVVAAADNEQSVTSRHADALCCDVHGTAIAVHVADCVPIVFADPRTGAFAVAHAGWRGTVAGVGAATVDTLRERFDVLPGDLWVALGPSIGPCCFEVGEEVAEAFDRGWSEHSVVERKPGRKAHVNLWQANRQALIECGVRDTHIDVLGACTACDRARFFSYRRDGRATGQHIAFVTIP